MACWGGGAVMCHMALLGMFVALCICVTEGSAWHAHVQLVSLSTCVTEGSAWHAHAQLVALGICVTWFCLACLLLLAHVSHGSAGHAHAHFCCSWPMCHLWLCLACTCSACCSWHMCHMALPGMHMLNLCHMALPGMHMLSLAIHRLRPPTSSKANHPSGHGLLS